MNHLRLLVATGLAILAVGCSTTPDDTPGSTPDTGDVDAEVEVRNIAFEPDAIEVSVGTTVVWTNTDIVRHTVTSGAPGDPDGAFDESLDASDGRARVTFDEAGTFTYHCDLHRNMTGDVIVTG